MRVVRRQVDQALLRGKAPELEPSFPGPDPGEFVHVHDEQGALVVVVGRMDEKLTAMARLGLKAYGTNPSTTYRSSGVRNRSRSFGFIAPSVTMRREGCRACGGATDAPNAHAVIVALSDWLQETFDAQVGASQRAQVAATVLPEWRLGDSQWTSGVVNYTSGMPYHYDRNNIPGIWSAMITVRRATRGGHLHLPELDLVLPCRDGEVMFFPGTDILHGVTPIRRVDDDGYRITAVWYAERHIAGCRPLAQELPAQTAARTRRESGLIARQHIVVEPRRPARATLTRDTVYVIASHNRPDGCATKSVATLIRHGVDPDRINVFVTPGQEAAYHDTMPNVTVRTGAPGLNAQRRAIHRAYPEGTRLVSLDDDVTELRQRVDDKTSRPAPNMDEIAEDAFAVCAAHGARLWGIYPVLNPMFMNDHYSVGLRLCIGHLWGCVNSHDTDLIDLETANKEDYERTLRWFAADGAVVRDDRIAAKTRIGAPGGLADEMPDRPAINETEVGYLTATWPELVSIQKRRSARGAEIRLKPITTARPAHTE